MPIAKPDQVHDRQAVCVGLSSHRVNVAAAGLRRKILVIESTVLRQWGQLQPSQHRLTKALTGQHRLLPVEPAGADSTPLTSIHSYLNRVQASRLM
jgi:hypothetical protein